MANLGRMWWTLWFVTFALLLSRFAGCGPVWLKSAISADKIVNRTPPPKSQSPSNTIRPTYTYVGEPTDKAENKTPGEDVMQAKPKIARQTRTDTTRGAIPDLDIRLAGNDIAAVMAHYGYLPAIKTRDALLGKIVRHTFVPLAESELSLYAARGRAGDRYPEAGKWKRQISRQLQIPEPDLQLIFLVPNETERFFIEMESKALAETGIAAADAALIRGHFTTDLALQIREIITHDGDIVTLDSLQSHFGTPTLRTSR